MKLTFLITTLVVLIGFQSSSLGQTFWTETFGIGCNTGTLANGFVSPNGVWNVTSTGFNGANANVWYISAEENGVGVGNCGERCGSNPTLHIGYGSGDTGAAYLKDNATGDPATDIRAESPTIDCSNECQVLLSFELIHNGDLELDNCSVWYFDGLSWAMLSIPKKTLLSCAPEGLWDNYSVYLPASANNNPNVRIGFQWVNNDDGIGTDPSIALYNIQLSSVDIEDPTILCSSDVDVYLNSYCEAQIPDLTTSMDVVVGDNCTSIANLIVSQNITVGTTLSGHLTSQAVEVTVQDEAGNTNSCVVTVQAIDTISPVLDCPVSPVPAYANSSCQAQLEDYATLLNPTDNCSAFADLVFTQSPVAGTTITDDQIIEFSVTDEAGNQRNCSFNVEFLDTISPTIICPADQTQETAAGTCDTLILNYTSMILWSDNCSATLSEVTITQNPAPLSTVSGISPVEITVVDESGNSGSCFFNLEVIDVEAPTINCPSAQTQPSNAACDIVLEDFTGDAIVTDNCSSSAAILINQSPAPGAIYSDLGTIIQVTLSATDEEGNFNSCMFDVEIIDTTAPEAFCPTDQTVNADANCEYELTDFSASVGATDNCTTLGNFVFSHQTPIGTVFNYGTHEIFMQAQDESGNIGTCSFTIEVVDVTPPVITDCAPDQLVLADNFCEGSLGDYTTLVSATDVCDGTNLIISQNPSQGTIINANTSITITVEDLSGNAATCSFNVVLEDQEPPVLTCPSDTIVNVNASCEYNAPDLTAVITGQDNCSAFVDMTVSQTPTAGTVLSGLDQIEVTLTDESGNSITCLVESIPNDVVAPEITCPADETINNGANCDFSIPDYTGLTAISENCPDYVLEQIPAIGSVVSVGIHEITVTIADVAGNQGECSFEIEVLENVAPTIACPAAISQCDSLVFYSAPSANDNCAIASISQTDLSGFTSGDIFPVGTTQQTYEVVDESGNTSSCSFSIEVLESPSIAQITNTPTSLCDTSSVILNAEQVESGTGEWFVITGNATLNNQFANSTGANNLDFGINQFVWQVTSAQCGSTADTITITLYDLPFPASIPNDSLTICYDTLVNLTANTPNVGQGTWYSSNNNVDFVNINASNTAAFNLDPGWNDIIWEIGNGSCPVSTDTVRVFATPRATIANNDTILCALQNTLQLSGNQPTVGVQSLWYLIEGNATIVSSSNPNTEVNNIGAGNNSFVYAFVNSVCGNSHDTLNVVINQCEDYNPVIPTVFTPNNDGKNDMFIVDNLHALYPTCEVKIVNRWGNLVYESIGYSNPWDGTFLDSGELLPTGTYFYRIDLKDDMFTEITGSISIIR